VFGVEMGRNVRGSGRIRIGFAKERCLPLLLLLLFIIITNIYNKVNQKSKS